MRACIAKQTQCARQLPCGDTLSIWTGEPAVVEKLSVDFEDCSRWQTLARFGYVFEVAHKLRSSLTDSNCFQHDSLRV